MATPEQVSALRNLLLVCVTLIIVVGTYAYMTEKDKHPTTTPLGFLGFSPFPSMGSIAVGMAANIVFGAIDNGGLFFGMDALEPFLPEGKLTNAGWGNTFSDGLGAFLGTFAGVIIKNKSGISDTPIWSEAIGIVIGCIIGLYVPKMITGKK